MKTPNARSRVSIPVIGLAMLMAVSTNAATITVTSTADAGGTCPGANCTLRQAIATASPGDTINFAASITTVTLTSAELLINKNLTISGPGANLLTVQRSTVGGTPNFRIFNIAGNFNVTLSRLTIANGIAAGDVGGGIAANGTVTIIEAAISGNAAASGGGISRTSTIAGTTTILRSTISGNMATNGGGIYHIGIAGSGSVTVDNGPISGNTAGQGGGLYTGMQTTATITNSTVSGNTAMQGGGIVRVGTVSAMNTIIAQNNVLAGGSGPDFLGTLISQGYNLIGNTSGATINGTTTGNQLNVNPLLGPLLDNSGPTKTHALGSGSTAIEGGHSSGANTDQRGLARPVVIPNTVPVGDGSDIGAYEVQADVLPGCSNINRVVNNNNDAGTGSLRFVIADVCAGTTITFAPNVTGAINLTSGELVLNKSVTISGPGANLLTVQRSFVGGTPAFRIFNVSPSSVIANISGLTIANGNPANTGGGISNTGTLTVTNSTISGNSAIGGGGIYNFATMTINRSTISGNSATAGRGGGIYNFATMTIASSTISGNSVSDDSGDNDAHGGGIATSGNGTVTITNSTISHNTSQLKAGGIFNFNTSLRSRNTIIALNTALSANPDMLGALISENFNLVGNNSGATITPAQFSDQIGTAGAPINPMLGPLQNNGGPTFTRALLAGSPAIDKGHSSGAATDQRGRTRPIEYPFIPNAADGDGGDIGAVEVSPPVPLSVVSRKLHGGSPFDINLPFAGSGIECRSGGATNDYSVVFTFPDPVTFSAASFNGTGSISSTSGSGTTIITVNLTGVTNAQNIGVILFGVNNGMGFSDVVVPMGVLVGDSNGDRIVNAGDVLQTRSRSGAAVDVTTYRSDVNADGVINSGDALVVRSRSGSSLPTSPTAEGK